MVDDRNPRAFSYLSRPSIAMSTVRHVIINRAPHSINAPGTRSMLHFLVLNDSARDKESFSACIISHSTVDFSCHSFIFIVFHRLASIFTNFHWFASIIIHRHYCSLIFVIFTAEYLLSSQKVSLQQRWQDRIGSRVECPAAPAKSKEPGRRANRRPRVIPRQPRKGANSRGGGREKGARRGPIGTAPSVRQTPSRHACALARGGSVCR